MPRQTDADPVAVLLIARSVLPGGAPIDIERTPTGVSTPVYRLAQGDTTCYLRLAEAPEDSVAPEALVHRCLRHAGARVPDIVHYEEMNDAIGRSIMVTIEIEGGPAQGSPLDSREMSAILDEAGRDLALINQLDVSGFGWIRRNRPFSGQIGGEFASFDDFVLHDLDRQCGRIEPLFSAGERATIRSAMLDLTGNRQPASATLVHGDFDLSHVFQREGRYTGIIDFGEIRGADRLYDLGHFAVHLDPPKLDSYFEPLLSGYRDVTSLDESDIERVWSWGVWIAVGRLAIATSRTGTEHYQRSLAAGIRGLLNRLVR